MHKELLKISELSYSYDSKNKVIDNLNFVILPSEVLQITGPNGMGKSTLLKIIAGFINDKNLNYKAEYNGKIIELDKLRSKISFILDTPELFEQLSGLENIKFFNMLWENDEYYYKRVLNFCREFGIEEFLEKPVEEYSLGTQHKLFLSIMLSREVDIYLMDEPFNTLDLHSRQILVEWINLSKNSSHVIVSHLKQDGLVFSRTFQMKKNGELEIQC